MTGHSLYRIAAGHSGERCGRQLWASDYASGCPADYRRDGALAHLGCWGVKLSSFHSYGL